MVHFLCCRTSQKGATLHYIPAPNGEILGRSCVDFRVAQWQWVGVVGIECHKVHPALLTQPLQAIRVGLDANELDMQCTISGDVY